MKLQNKVALITGSSSGIGLGIAKLFAKEGANVILCSNQKLEEINTTLEEIKETGSDTIYLEAELTNEQEIKELFEQIKDKYGRLDILINNAGRTFNVPFDEITAETISLDIDTNLKSAILCSKYAKELMINEGWIINTSSIRGADYSGRPGIIGYCAAKAGINSFTKNLALELSPKIYVNAVAPGFVNTKYMETVPSKLKNEWINNTPINRMINPDEIAEIFLMLATTKILTGTIITADGGYSILNR